MHTLKKAAAVAALVGAALLTAGYYDGDQQLIETTYVVEPGDTVWSIGERHLKLNTGGRRYLPEFIQGIEELNPWIKEQNYMIHPGDEVRINYWVKAEKEEPNE
jgi:protein involved in polysaccharide export with SLBB domain